MFPKNGSGVDAAGDCGAWELDERATKQSGHAERGWVYKGPDAGGQNGNSSAPAGTAVTAPSRPGCSNSRR